ncbi:MAG: hypothetical protein DBY32_11415 [Phascolarctobacterium sp.]|nr:MAG: hypothetical protein DBY32_11415 [Phascolarctobacterium sp.]
MPEKVNRKDNRVLQVRISEELKAAFDDVIAKKGYNKSAVLRKIVEDWIRAETDNQ